MLLISIILVSLIAVGAVSAADNSTDVIMAGDVDEVQTSVDASEVKPLAVNDANDVLSDKNDSIQFDIFVNDTPYDEDVVVNIGVSNANSSVNYNNTQVNLMVDGSSIGNTTLNNAGKASFVIPTGTYNVGSYYITASTGALDTAVSGTLFNIIKANPIVNVENVTVNYGEIVTVPFNVTNSKGEGISGDVIITIFWQEDSLSKYVRITNGTASASFNLADLIGIFGGNSTFDIGSLFGGNGTNGTFNISSLLNGTGIGGLFNGTSNLTIGNSTFDISSLLNGTFSLGNTTFDIGGIFNGTTPITIGNTTIDFSSLFNKNDDSTGSGEVLSIPSYADKISYRTVDVADLLGGNSTFDFGSLFGENSTFKIGNSTFDISSLLNGTISIGNTSFNISSLLNGTNISIGNTTLDFSSLLNGTNSSSFDISSILKMLLGTGNNTLAYAFPPGDYKIAVTYLSSRNYNEMTNDTAILHILPKEDVVFTADITTPRNYGDDTIVSITVKDGYGKPISNATVSVLFNDKDQGNITVDENGTYVLAFDNLVNGTYSLVLAYNGTNDTFAFNVTLPVPTKIIAKSMTVLTVNTAVDGKIGKYFTLVLKDSFGNVLANEKVQLAFNGKIYNLKTDENGTARLQMNIPRAGVYAVSVCYLGDADYAASFATAKVVVKKQNVRLTTTKKIYKSNAKVKRLVAVFKSIKGKPLKGKIIKFTVKGKTYTARTNAKGIAVVNVKLAKKGNYIFTARFLGDNTYNAAVKKAILVLR